MSRPTVIVCGVLALLGIGFAALTVPAQGPEEPSRPDALSDKPVLVLSKQADLAATLEQAQVRSVGGRKFVVGKEMKDSPYTEGRFAGGTIWIPLDDVTQLVELSNTEQNK